MSSHAALSAAADDRKARLAKLRSIKRKQPGDEIVPPESDRASPAVVTQPKSHGDETGEEGNTGEIRETSETAVERDVSRLHLSGRNYDPETRNARLGFEVEPNLAAGNDTVEAQAAKLEADVRREQHEEEGGDGEGADGDARPRDSGGKPIDLFKLQPKKPNWDLKRELNKRLEPLNARTDNAIGRLVRERLAAKQQQQQQSSNQAAASNQPTASATTGEADEGGLDGAALVEGIRLREQEAEEEERRERELEDEGRA
ncbi:coiled-coil domain-containing protein 12 [Sporothrix brasiliensis 5110]|uniref:Coiled-coil domain-containing protein 12 n=1 Tax=Sporothrix brasiliensis 5110 TaxID=1398154 RepID=A0A0C2EPF1_9PEZI|nr:coiled-coil domain-containing protein 12 [Sporothrix brasiliensis 5110]KIH88099.1 coiled-coil domain-containing protein 12 [Sporothrix brasiliensis 5110]